MKRFQSIHGTAGHDALRVVHSSERQLIGKTRSRRRVQDLKHATASFVIRKTTKVPAPTSAPGDKRDVASGAGGPKPSNVGVQRPTERPPSRERFRRKRQGERSRQTFDRMLKLQARKTNAARLRVSSPRYHPPSRPQTHSGSRPTRNSLQEYVAGPRIARVGDTNFDRLSSRGSSRPATAGSLRFRLVFFPSRRSSATCPIAHSQHFIRLQFLPYVHYAVDPRGAESWILFKAGMWKEPSRRPQKRVWEHDALAHLQAREVPELKWHASSLPLFTAKI